MRRAVGPTARLIFVDHTDLVQRKFIHTYRQAFCSLKGLLMSSEAPKNGSEDGKSSGTPARRTKKIKAAAADADFDEATVADQNGSDTDETTSTEDANASNGRPNWDRPRQNTDNVDWAARGPIVFRFIVSLFAMGVVGMATGIIYMMMLAHFVYSVITRERLDPLSELSGRISAYVRQLLDFVSCYSDEPIFPFAPFPEASDTEPQMKTVN